MKNLLIVCFSEIASDPRVLKQIFWSKDHYRLTVAGFGDYVVKEVEFIKISPPNETLLEKTKRKLYMASGQFEKFYWSLPFVKEAYQKLKDRRFDLIIANELQTLPMAVKFQKDAKIIFDAHEFYLSDIEGNLVKRYIYRKYAFRLLNKYLRSVSHLTTVSETLARLYSEIFKIESSMVPNVPFYYDVKPKKETGKLLKIVHHGGASPERNLDEIIKGAGSLAGFCELHLYLVPKSTSYYNYLRNLAENFSNIYFHNPVPYSQIVKEINEYDLGVHFLKSNNVQTRYAIPNKLFEFVQARLGLIVSPQPEMKKFVEKHGIGVVASGYSSKDFAKAIKALTKEDIWLFKQKSDEIAKVYCAENYKEHFLKILERIQK
jgi:hypothetical protein